MQAVSRDALRAELSNRAVGGIIFTTLQKFGRTRSERDSGASHPLLSERRNVIVIVDEAHRSHYDHLDGYARQAAAQMPSTEDISPFRSPTSLREALGRLLAPTAGADG